MKNNLGISLEYLAREGMAWICSFAAAWIVGKVVLWNSLLVLSGWLLPERTNNLTLNETNNYFHNLWISIIGIAIATMIKIAQDVYLNNKLVLNSFGKKVVKRTAITLLAVYFYIYGLNQTIYWWHLSAIQINNYEAGLIRELNIIKAISTLCLLNFDNLSFFTRSISIQNSIKRIILLTSGRLIEYGVIFIFYLWSSIPNENLGIPSVAAYTVLALSVLFYQTRTYHKSEKKNSEY